MGLAFFEIEDQHAKLHVRRIERNKLACMGKRRGEIAGIPRDRDEGKKRVVAFRSNPSQTCHRKQRGFPHVHCAAVNNRSRDNGSACFSPRTHHPSGRASFEADARRKGASLAANQAETSSASLTDTSGVLPRAQPPQDPAKRAKLQGEIASLEFSFRPIAALRHCAKIKQTV